MTSDRPYRKGISTIRAYDAIKEGRGTQFDTAVAEVMLEVLRDGRLIPEGRSLRACRSLPSSPRSPHQLWDLCWSFGRCCAIVEKQKPTSS